MAKSAKAATKSEILANIAEATELTRKQVASVFDALAAEIKSAVGKKGPGIFTVPGLMKVTVVHKPAVQKRKGINPFTKEPITIPAKPASKKVRATALKALKDLVQ